MLGTGKKDKNGKEIFTDDIVIVYEYLEGKPWNLHNAVIDWRPGNFMLNPAYRHQSMDNELEIIGNIHENPELINGPSSS